MYVLAALSERLRARLLGRDHPRAVGLFLRRDVHRRVGVAGRRRTLEEERAVGFLFALGHDLHRHRPSRRGVDREHIGLDRHRGQRRHGDAEVDDEDRHQHEVDGAGYVTIRVRRLLRHVGDGLDARVGDRADRDAVDEVRPGGRHAEVDLLDQHLRRKQQHHADDHEEDLRAEVEQRQDDIEARRLLDAEDVERHQEEDRDDAADGVVREGLERGPEDGEVVGHEVGADGHGDDVVEHQRPAGAEADELVEGPAAETRGAAGLRHHGGGLGIRPGGRAEEQSRQEEDERRDPEGPQRHKAQSVVDRRADVAVRRAEQRGDAENLLQSLPLARLSACHCPPLPPSTSPSTSAARRRR